MAIAPRSSRRSSIDIWPGFVDALAQLLMVIIFILLVFTAGQFYLSEALSGRDQALLRLQQQVNELGDLLALERRATEDLRVGAADLSAQLSSSLAERDQLTRQSRGVATSSATPRAVVSCATSLCSNPKCCLRREAPLSPTRPKRYSLQ